MKTRPTSRYEARRRRVAAIRNGTGAEFEISFPKHFKFVAVCFGIIVIWIYASIARVLIGELSVYWARAAGFLHQESIAGSVALVISAIGYGFYRLRKKSRMLYSVIEFLVALIITTETSLRTKDPVTLAAALMSSIYLVVRAFDNFEKAFQEWEEPTVEKTLTTPTEVKEQ